MVRLLNAAVMPVEGTYILRRLTPEAFERRLSDAFETGELHSSIGYPECQRMLAGLTGITVPLSRESTPVNDGDTLLICRLRYRVGNPALKSKVVATVDDYEFFVAAYSAEVASD